MTFDEWWEKESSGFTAKAGEDPEKHVKRVAIMAWNAALSVAEHIIKDTPAEG